MERAGRAVLETLGGDQRTAVERVDELDARIDRAVAHAAAVELGEDHGAGAAVALGAALLRAGPAEILPEMLQDGPRRLHAGHGPDFAVEEIADGGSGRLGTARAGHEVLSGPSRAAPCAIRYG